MFEVAPVKQCQPADRSPSTASPGRLGLGCWPLLLLIQDACEVFAAGRVDPRNPAFPFTPIEGLPDWARSARYSIDARVETPQSGAMMRGPMMQRLLEERFQLKLHRETREVPVYRMTAVKGGAKLKRTPPGSCQALDPTVDASRPPTPGGLPYCVVAPPERHGSARV